MNKRVGVIGCGYWGKNLVRNFHELGALGVVCDAEAQRARFQQEQFTGIETAASIEELLSLREIDCLVIATPAVTHFSLARKALMADKHVFVEKPMAMNVREGEALLELAEQRRRVLMVGHVLEYHPALLKLKELVGRGDLGDIHYIYSNRLNLGRVRQEENILWSFAPHDISVLLSLVREFPVGVSASGGNYLQVRIADVTVTTLSFPGGTRAHIFVSWLHPYKEQKLVVIGSRKMAVFNDTAPSEKLKIYDKGIEWIDGAPRPRETAETILFFPPQEPLGNECREFLDAVETGRSPLTDGHNGLQVLRILEACQQSMESGGMTVNLEVDREVNLGAGSLCS